MDEITEELSEPNEDHQSGDSEVERVRRDRVASWVEETALHTQDKSPRDQPEPPEPVQMLRANPEAQKPEWSHLNPMAPEFQASSNTHLINMIQTLHMPKADMMTFDGDPLRFWTFIKAFDNNIGEAVAVHQRSGL